jgi:hypothetical protein
MLVEQDRHEMECDFQGDLERDTKPRRLKGLIIELLRNARCSLQLRSDICYSISSIVFKILVCQTLPSSNLRALII